MKKSKWSSCYTAEFTETQQWTQQFIADDSGKLVDLASAKIKQAWIFLNMHRTNQHPILIGHLSLWINNM
jgi:hypothetical protein